ncbi:MAG: helix-turn-helix domain-containing protein, partial [Clostridia bacterium]|nr:helix-turn-helix domain-containing protein [Clostridia bacterium]
DKIMIERDKKDEWFDINNYIENNLNEKLTLEGLAKKCYYNPTYFSRVFKEKFGMNLSMYLSMKRVEYAKQLLLEGNRIEYIIEKAGFSSRHMFYEQFKKHVGLSVSEFRKREKIL